MMGALTKLKTEVEVTLHKLFISLNDVAKGHAPKEYLKFMEKLASELSAKEHLKAERVKSYTYAALDKEGQLVFAGYIILEGVINDQGKIAPALYIVLKWTVGGEVEVFIEHDFVAPTLLNDGIPLESTKEAVKAIEQQLALEGFSTQVGNLPAITQIREPAGGLRPDAFAAGEHIKAVRADKDELIFELKTHKEKEVEAIAYQIFPDVKAIVKNRRATSVRMKSTGNIVTFTFTNMEPGKGVHPSDLDFLIDKYHLNNNQTRRLVNTINRG
jgi:hypothetical protein